MSHRVHPKGFRIRELTDWLSRGFYGDNPGALLEEDYKIREFLEIRTKKSVAFFKILAEQVNLISTKELLKLMDKKYQHVS